MEVINMYKIEAATNEVLDVNIDIDTSANYLAATPH